VEDIEEKLKAAEERRLVIFNSIYTAKKIENL
jgi:hypothetical protein